MPIYQLDIEKFLNGEYWSNRYFVSSSTIAAAEILGQTIVAAERLFHSSLVTFTKLRTSTVAAGDDSYITTILDQLGAFSATGDLLPLFNVVRVDFNKDGGGRPYRKLYRGCLGEGLVTGSVITSGSFIEALQDGLDAIDGIVSDGLGTALFTGVLINRIAMRQLRRGSRRRTQAILP
jgi:hypothetical protein